MRACSRVLCAALFVGLFGWTANAQAAEPGGIAWQRSLTQAIKTTRAQRRPMLVYVTTDGCMYCHLMKDNTFSDHGVASTIRRRFVPVTINAADRRDAAEALGVTVFPTTLIIQADQGITDVIRGYVGPDELQARLASASSRKVAAAR